MFDHLYCRNQQLKKTTINNFPEGVKAHHVPTMALIMSVMLLRTECLAIQTDAWQLPKVWSIPEVCKKSILKSNTAQSDASLFVRIIIINLEKNYNCILAWSRRHSEAEINYEGNDKNTNDSNDELFQWY